MKDSYCGDIVLAGIMTKPPLPTLGGSAWKIGAGRQSTLADLPDDKILDYISPLYESIHRLKNVQCIVLHDGLPKTFTDKYGTEQFLFEYVTADPTINAYDRRFFAFRDFIKANDGLDRIFITDVNDVAFVTNPFEWWNELGIFSHYLLIGEEWTKFQDNDWWKGSLSWMPDDYTHFFTHEYADKLPLTCGTFAGKRSSLVPFMNAFCNEMERVLAKWKTELPPVPADMQAFNVTAYRHFIDDIAVFKMDAYYPGVKLLGPKSPLQHDRAAALEILKQARIRDGLGDIQFRVGTEDRLIWDSVVVKNEYNLPDDMTGQYVLDVGGHIGGFAYACLSRGAEHVLSIEPDPANFDLLQKNLMKFGSRATQIRAAIWRSDKGHENDELFHTGYGTNTGGGHCKPTFGVNRVPLISLDNAIEMADFSINHDLLIKFDCEGGEFPALYTSVVVFSAGKVIGEYHGLASSWLGDEIGGYKTNHEGLRQYFKDIGFKNVEVTDPDPDGNKCGKFFVS